jgi:hypothetical protein
VYGRDLHASGALTAPPSALPRPPQPAPPPVEPARPAAAPALAGSGFRRAAAPSHTGKSNFPARAGFWGRRNSHGDIVPLTDPGLIPAGMWRWRVTVLPHVLVVLASAALSFAAVMLVMKLREPPPAPPAPTTPAPTAAQPLLSPPPAVAPTGTQPAQVSPGTPSDTPSARPRTSRPRRTPGYRPRQRIPGPDDPIPPRF